MPPVGMSRMAKLFALNKPGFNLPRGAFIAGVMLVPLIVLAALHEEKYFLSMSFAVLFVGLSDPGGSFGRRAQEMSVVGLLGALLTALGFGIAGAAWGFVVLAAFLITLLGGLAMKFGLHRFVAGALLNAWFLVALAMPAGYAADRIQTNAWAQALAWLIGAALWVGFVCVMWLARGRSSRPEPVPEIPGDVSVVELTRPVILFAVIRALAVSFAVAIAFGLHVPNADWMPIATFVAMKSSLQQSALAAEQRLAGALIGAVIAVLVLLTMTNRHALQLLLVVLGALAASVRTVNYALYTAMIAAFVLIGMDIPHPTNLANEERRVLFTFVGVGIATLVMLLANLVQKRTARPTPQAT